MEAATESKIFVEWLLFLWKLSCRLTENMLPAIDDMESDVGHLMATWLCPIYTEWTEEAIAAIPNPLCFGGRCEVAAEWRSMDEGDNTAARFLKETWRLDLRADLTGF